MTHRVLSLRADSGGCAKYRIIDPANAVQAAGFDFDVRIDTNIAVEASKDSRTGRVTVHEVQEDVDLLIVQRPLDHSWVEVFRQAQEQGIACIFELDDDFEFVHPQNAAWPNVQPDRQPLSNWQWLHKTAALADHVTVSTPALLRYAPHGRGTVVRNYVTETVEIDRSGIEAPRVGWSGMIATHPRDLDETRGGVARALKELGSGIHVLGAGEGVRRGLGLTDPTIRMYVTKWVPVDAYMQSLAELFEIGIVPLEPGNFNEAKSHLKGLEMAACGIPFVASPTSEYRRMNAWGLGELASAPGDWRRHIVKLARGDRWRREGERHRELVAKSFMIADHAHEWADAWTKAIEHRRSMSR